MKANEIVVCINADSRFQSARGMLNVGKEYEIESTSNSGDKLLLRLKGVQRFWCASRFIQREMQASDDA